MTIDLIAQNIAAVGVLFTVLLHTSTADAANKLAVTQTQFKMQEKIWVYEN